MAANIRSYRNGIDPVDAASRDDLQVGDSVLLVSLDAATTYSWVIAFAPEGSAATLTSPSSPSPGTFTVDQVGPYLIRLTVDVGLPTESTQYVRLRALSSTLGLKLVAAGERRDETGIIPVDVDTEGWANEQNANLLALEAAIGPGGGPEYVSVFKEVPAAPGDAVDLRGWASLNSVVDKIRVCMETVNTQGNYTVEFTNETTGNTMLSASSFDMNTLTTDTVTDLTLTGTSADLQLSATDRWRARFTSDNAAFDGSGIYFEILFRKV